MEVIDNKLLGKEELLLEKLLKFYSNPNHLGIFVNIVEEESGISLRLLDWFSTNYSQFNNIYISNIDIHSDYKGQLKGFKKQYFDPFCRRERIILSSDDCDIRNTNNLRGMGEIKLKYRKLSMQEFKDYNIENESSEKGIMTTIGQLNFFKWCIEKNIISYIVSNLKDIEKSMPSFNSKKNRVNGNDNRLENKKKVLYKNGGNVYKTFMHVTIKFN